MPTKRRSSIVSDRRRERSFAMSWTLVTQIASHLQPNFNAKPVRQLTWKQEHRYLPPQADPTPRKIGAPGHERVS
jgi:hypothetical protein